MLCACTLERKRLGVVEQKRLEDVGRHAVAGVPSE
jgi:hypothetical protein